PKPAPAPASGPRPAPPAPTAPGRPLSPAEDAVRAALLAGGAMHHDELVAALAPRGVAPGALAEALLMMELDGLVRALPGRRYEAG
ncbi:MAG: hypothetical protein SF028_08545, partial [Candidatus Sumerlaeia bacterium]|nr:hypothetical protein [Candidatus Sumerlaeia bacterium]